MELQGLLLPGRGTSISLTIDIDSEMAAELNQFGPRLEATLILHVALGKDHFVPVSASYGVFFFFFPLVQIVCSALFRGSGFLFMYGRIYPSFHCLIRADVLRKHAVLPDTPQGAHKGRWVCERPADRRRGEECAEGSHETRKPDDVWRRSRCGK